MSDYSVHLFLFFSAYFNWTCSINILCLEEEKIAILRNVAIKTKTDWVLGKIFTDYFTNDS